MEHLRGAATQLWEAGSFLKEVTSKPKFVRGPRESVAKGLPGGGGTGQHRTQPKGGTVWASGPIGRKAAGAGS